MSNINNEQAEQWIENIAKNLSDFRKKHRLKKEDKIKYVQEQYQTLLLIKSAIEGEVIFVGAKQIN